MLCVIAYIVNHSKDALSITSLSKIDYYFYNKKIDKYLRYHFPFSKHYLLRKLVIEYVLYLYDLINYLFHLRPFFLKIK